MKLKQYKAKYKKYKNIRIHEENTNHTIRSKKPIIRLSDAGHLLGATIVEMLCHPQLKPFFLD